MYTSYMDDLNARLKLNKRLKSDVYLKLKAVTYVLYLFKRTITTAYNIASWEGKTHVK